MLALARGRVQPRREGGPLQESRLLHSELDSNGSGRVGRFPPPPLAVESGVHDFARHPGDPVSTSIGEDPAFSETPATECQERRGWRLYQILRLILRPLRGWVRLRVKGLEHLPAHGAALVVANHDSWLDPLALAEAMMWKGRQLRFLAKHTLWKFRPMAMILDGAAQIPIRRGESDTAALESAVEAIGRGEMIGVFPEGTLSRGTVLRARRGVSRLARACPGVPVILVAIAGGTDLKRFPKRPRVEVEFFPPADGLPDPAADPADFAQGLLDQIREKVPQVR